MSNHSFCGNTIQVIDTHGVKKNPFSYKIKIQSVKLQNMPYDKTTAKATVLP